VGAIDFETTETAIVFDATQIEEIVPVHRNDPTKLWKNACWRPTVATVFRASEKAQNAGAYRVHERPIGRTPCVPCGCFGELGCSLAR